MVLLKVLHQIFRRRCGFLLLGLMAITAQLMGQSLVSTGSQPFAVAVNPATNKIYVVNNGPNTVTVIDGATNATRTVQVGRTPVAVAVNTVTNEAYVANSGDGTVTRIDADGNTKRIQVGLNPQAIIVNPVTNKIYVAASNGGIVSEFNPNGNVVVIDGTDDTVKTTIPGGKNPFAIAFNPVTNRIYVANNANGSNATVDVIDGSTDTIAGSIRLPNSPDALAVNPVTNKIYVINANFVTVIDGVSNTIRTTTALPVNPLTAIAVNPVTNFIYITSSVGIGTLFAINGATDALSGIALIGGGPLALAVNSLTNLIYVTNSASGVVVIDGSTNNRVDSIFTGSNPRAVAVNPVTNRVYVANNAGSNVAVVDGATKTTSSIPAGNHPSDVAVNQVTNKVYVPNIDDNNVTVIDAANGNATSAVSTGTNPTAAAVNPATNKIYVPNIGSADVTVIDGLNGNATTQVSAGRGPFAVAVNTVTNKAYVTNSGDGTVTVIDGTNGTTSIPVGTTPQGLAINEVTNTIVVANRDDNTVTVINGDTNATTTVPVGSGPVAVGVNATENNFYVVNQGSDTVTVIDGDTLQPIDLIRVRDTPGAVVVNPLLNRIYVVNHFSNSVSVIDGASGNVIDTVPTGSLPNALDLNLLTNKIYVTNQNDGTVTVIDGAGDTVSATVPTGTIPSGVAVNPVTNQVYVSNASSDNVTVITVGVQQPVPLNVELHPVVSGSDTFTSGGVFSTFNETPSFNVTVTSAYASSDPYAGYIGTVTNPPPTQVYFSVDGVTPWSPATPTGASGSNPATYTITLGPQDSGLHTLYVFAAYGNGVGHNSSGTGTGNSPEISNLQRLPLLVLPNATSTALVSDAPNGAQEGTRITFTATVTESGSPVTEGEVQFYQDGKTRGLPIQVNSNGVAIDTDNSLTSGSHTIQAVYLGTDKFVESSASLTQIIYGLPTAITVSSGSGQNAAVNTNYASPLVAIVKDAVGDPVPNITVTWAANGTTTTADGTLSAATSITDANGLASVNVTANSKAGSFQVTASAVGPPAQFTLTNTAGAATSITTSSGSSPQAAVINTQFIQPLTVLVTDAGSNPVQGVTVTYVANGTTANASLSAPSAVTDIDGLAHVIATANGTTGAYTVTAAAGSVGSVNFALRNNAAATTTSLAPTTQTVIYGNTISFTANVNQSTATGTVNFFLGTELLGTATLSAGSATLALNQILGTGQYLPVGTYNNVTATYTGDTNFAGSSSGPVQVTVTKRTAAGGLPALTVVANSVTRPFGQPNPPFSYTVVGTLVPGDTPASAVTGTAVYTTSAVLTSLVGTYPLSVSGLVSANYEIAFQDGTVTVMQGNSTTTIATASANLMYGDQEVLTAAVTQGATGTVSFYEGSTLLGTASLDSATQAELPISTLPVGVHTITATFNGGPNLLPSTSSPATVTVTQRTGDEGAPALTIVVRNATRPATGEFAIFTYYVTGQLFNNDTYETAITGTARLASPAGSDPGTYPITISGLTSNNYTLTSVPGTLIVTDDAIGKPSTTTLTVNPSSGQYGDPITLTATVSPAVASGRVTFYDVLPSGGTVFIGDATLSGGTATFVTSTLTVETHSVEAAYSGDGIYSTSLSLPSTVTVAKKQGPGPGGAALTITVQNASRQFGTANPYFPYIVTGTLLPGDSFDSAVTGVAVYATTDTSSSPVGTTYPITVSGLVSQNYEIATVPGTLTIVASPSTTALIAAATTGFTAAQYGDAVTLTATVEPTTATGTVVFLEGQNVLGTAQSGSGTGIATLALTTLQAGRHTITATYLGDNNLGDSTSTPVTIVVSQKTGPSGEPYLIVAPNDTSRIYGQANPAFTYTVSGALLNGDIPATAVKGVPIYSTSASLGSPAGTYPVSIAGGLSSLNYLIEFQDGTFTVTPTSLTVALTSSANPVTYGGIIPVIFTATLPIDATGTVTFYDGTAVLGTETVSGGVATQPTSSLTAGTHSITAQYGGDINYGAAESTVLSQVVTLATPALTLTSSLNPSTFGTSMTFRAALPTDATGTVTFLDGTTALGTGTVGTGIATLTISSLTAGTHSVTAQYGGDANYGGAVSTAVSQVVNKASSTVALASSPNPSTFGTSVTLTATLPSGATGSVTFQEGATTLGTGTISSGVATLAISSLTGGTHSITAQYAGDTNYTAAVSTPVSQVVNKATSTVSLASSPNPSTFGASVTLTATVTSGATGSVTFQEGAATLGTGTIGSGVATFTTGSLTGGTHSITAQYGGDTNFTAAVSTPVSQVVNKATPTVTLASSLNPSTFGASVTLTATLPSGATGIVTFEDNGTAISGAVPISGTTASFATSTLVAGSHGITAVYSGDSNYNGANSLLLTQTVNMATTGPSTTLSVSPTAVMYGDPAVLTAVLGPPSGATGTVSFHEGATLLGTSSLDGSATAVFSVSTLNVGTHTITATYNGDVNFPASTSNPVTLTVTQRTGAGGGASLTVTVNDASRTTTQDNPPFSHTVAGELVNGDTYATAVTGTPTYSTTAGTTAGTFEITVSGLTSQNYVLAFVPGTLTVVPSESSTMLAASPNSSQYGDPMTLTATVTSGATGTASFYDSSVFLGQEAVTGGVATLSTTTLNVGTHTITATYNGDATYASSMSEPTTVTVAKNTAPGSSLTVTVLDESREYGTANPEFAYIVSGTLVNGDTYATAVTGVPVYSVADTPTSPVGSTFPINVSGLVSQNYTLTFVPGTLTIVTAPTTTSLTTSATSTQYGDPVTLTATVAPRGATGTVVFSKGFTVLGTATVSGGTATFSTSALSAGTNTITASYEGDGNFAASTSSAVTVTVAKRTGPGGVAALTVTVTDASRQYGQGNPAFSYTVSGTLVNGDTYATAVTGVPVYSTPATVTSPVGTYPISITGGLSSANYSLAFVNGTLNVSKGTPSVTVASSLNSSIYGTSVTLTAAIPAGSTGTVTFADNGTAISGAVAISGTTATFTTATLAAGTHPITAVYSGDSNYNGAISSVLTQGVNQATLTVMANNASRAYGTANPAFTGTITGFVNGDTEASVVTGTPSLTTTATMASPAGTYPITAALGTLATNNNYGFAFVDGTLTVTPAPGETTTLSVNPARVMYGDPAVLTAVVGPTAGATGTVSFHEGPTLLGTSSLDGSATAVLPVSTLNAGTHRITATYNGDANFPPSTSNPATLTVTQRIGPGGGAALTVTVNDATRTTTEANPPFSHTVAGELVNGDTYATAVTGTPTYSTTAGTTAGTFAITVTGLSSANYTLAFVPGTLMVVPSSSSTTLATSPNSAQYGDPVMLTATVTSGATGTASFYDGSVYLGQGTVTGGVATLSTTTLNAGTHTITATYNGDATYASSMSGPATVTVAKKTGAGGGPALTVTVLNESREYGTANPEFSYIVSGMLVNGDTNATAVTGVPVYSVPDSPNSPAGSTFPINVSGLVSQNYTLTFVPGTLTIVTAPTTTALAIMSPTTTTAQTTSVTSQYGDPATLTATVAPTSATGTVVFSNGSTVVGSAPVFGGTATFTGSTLSVGTKTVTTAYQGDANHAASTSSPVTAIVTPRTGPGGGAALTVTVANASRQYGQGNPAFSNTVSGTLVNGDTYATAVTGVPVYSTTATVTSPVGTYPISITGGLSSANYSVAFVNGTLTVSKGTPSVTVASSQNPSAPAASVTFTATLSAGATGTVTFMDGTTVLGNGTVSGSTASFSTSTLSVGTHSITTGYSGDGNYNGVTSPALSQVVNKTATTVTVASSRNPAPSGTSVTFTATVPAGATGTVQFLDGTTALGTGTVSGGTASFSTTTLSVGTHPITAVYSGDASYNGAASSAISQLVQTVGGPQPTFTIASTTGPQLIPPGASASYSITVTPVNGAFNNVVTLTATNLPPGSSYTFAPTALTPGSAGATSTFTVSVPHQSAALRRASKTPFALAILLLPLAFLRRTRARPPRLLLGLLLGLTSFGAISGCGAGGYFNQPQQTYTITITAASGNVANSSTVTLTVQ